MPQLYFTDRSALRARVMVDGASVGLSEEEISAANNLHLVDGMPFILGTDGSYDNELNRFFRACPTLGVHSLNSLRAYAYDILVWLRFLSERRGGKSVWIADREDVVAFHEARRLSPPPHRIAASSWNRAVAALDKFYRWAVEEKLIERAPFTYRQVWTRALDGSVISVAANMARERNARNGDMRFVSLDRYVLFRDVGLRGRLPDGREDPTWRGRNGERNALFAELLVTTGLRLQEASHLLTVELPTPDRSQGQRSLPFRLAAAIAKGGKSREIRLPLRLLERLDDYAGVERTNAVGRWRQRRAWKRIDAPIMAMGHDRQSLHFEHGHVRFDRLNPGERRRLLDDHSKEPLALWLTEGGLPMPMASWQAVFRRASTRCSSFGFDIEVTPHMLRHTFAVHMLTLLLHEQIGWMLEERAGRMSPAYRRLIGDPLLKLQRLMGHSRIESTYIYLDHLDDAQALVDSAVEQWGLDIASARGA